MQDMQESSFSNTHFHSIFDLPLLFFRTTGLHHMEKIYFASTYLVWRTPGPGAPRTLAFPPGFKMIARQSSGPKARVSFDCSGQSACERGTENCKPIHTCEGNEGSCFPTSRCSELEIKIVFPACWDGKRLTSANFMDHVAYGQGQWSDQGDAYFSECPATHKVRIPEVHFYFRILNYEVNISLQHMLSILCIM